MINLEEAVVRKLKATQHVLCTIESCTGGLVSNLITNVSGASEVYWGSWITYDNSSKEELGVPSAILKEYGAVSKEAAKALAEAGLTRLETSASLKKSPSLLSPKGYVSIATTGIAGPTGGSREKPVGLCFLALAISGRETHVEEFHAAFTEDRIAVKIQFAQKALELLRGNL